MSKSKATIHKPGQKAPESGQYGVVGPKGGKTGTEVTVTKGATLPPTQKPGQGFTLDDKTQNIKVTNDIAKVNASLKITRGILITTCSGSSYCHS